MLTPINQPACLPSSTMTAASKRRAERAQPQTRAPTEAREQLTNILSDGVQQSKAIPIEVDTRSVQRETTHIALPTQANKETEMPLLLLQFLTVVICYVLACVNRRARYHRVDRIYSEADKTASERGQP